MQEESLKIRVFHIKEVSQGDHFHLGINSLVIPRNFDYHCANVEQLTIQLIPPHQHDIHTNTIMDIIPISTKVLGSLGTGITHTLTGVTVLMSGSIVDGEQMHEFGSTQGLLSENIQFNQVGTPDERDYIILIDMLVKKGCIVTRQICLELFNIVDQFIQKIRELLKLLDGREAVETHVYEEKQHLGKPKVAIIKQVAGQGAMYDTLLFPKEPSGFAGGLSIIALNNMPIFLSPNEYRDGAIRAMV